MGVILVVDDDEFIMEMLELRLSIAGHQVLKANNGADGINQAMSSSPDLILMDMHMPVMSGLEAVKQLRAQGYTGLIASLSADAMEENINEQLEAGCDASITKPIGNDFEMKIKDLIG